MSIVKPVFHFNLIVKYRSIFFCVEVISSTLPLKKKRNTVRYVSVYDTVEVENWLYYCKAFADDVAAAMLVFQFKIILINFFGWNTWGMSANAL